MNENISLLKTLTKIEIHCKFYQFMKKFDEIAKLLGENLGGLGKKDVQMIGGRQGDVSSWN